MRLPCDNLDDFINDQLHHYSVTDRIYKIGQTVTLYNEHKQHDFRIVYILNLKEHSVLHLKNVDIANRELISSYYFGHNVND